MKNFKKIHTLGAIILAIGATSVTAFAASAYRTPADAVAGLTGKSVESVITEKQESNKTYGTMAAEAGKLEEFKAESIEMKKEHLKAKVAAGTMTQEEADAIIKAIEENQEDCDGTGSKGIGQNKGARFGSHGKGRGLGQGQGKGQGRGNGGMRLQDGSCR